MWRLYIIISVLVVLYLYKYIEDCKKRETQRILEEKMQREEKRREEKRRQTELREKARKQNIYWSYLPNIYNNYSKEILRKSLEILQEIKWCHSMAGDFDNPSSDFDFNVWTDYCSQANELQKQVAKLLGSPLWKIDSTGGQQWSDYPVWEELDIKYLSNLF